jgi:hypothetical protein
MSATKFTPGPWEYYAYLVYAPGPNGANICAISEPRATTAVQYTRVAIGSPDSAEVVANATLIAEAPAMYGALEPFAREAAIFMPGGSLAHLADDDGASVPIGTLRRAFVALQRARGETP